MAYVAISNNLINTTTNNIIKMRDKEKSTVTPPPDRMNLSNTDANLELMVWGNHLHLRDQMPDDWKTTVSRVNLRIEYKLNEADHNPQYHEFLCETSDPMEVPQTRDQSYYGINVVVPESSHLLPQKARESLAHAKFCRETDNKWSAIKSQVTKFLESTKSLNEGLKLWPALALYISDEYIDRVNNNPKREKTASRAEEIMASLSIDELTAAAVASKLTV